MTSILPLAAAACTFIIGLMAMVLQSMRAQRPEALIRKRMLDDFELARELAEKRELQEEAFFTLEKSGSRWERWVEPKLLRLQTVAGPKGIRIIVGVAVFVLFESLIAARLLPVPEWLGLLSVLLEMPFAVYATYRALVQRFRNRFLEAFPDALDTIVRAVRAGVPVTHVIGTVADDAPAPLNREFRIMADSLQVGRDINEVLDTAVGRIEIADFTFFCVCLLLQRETGGQLGETLENLAGIVRSRREIRQKTKSLTAESRMTTKILSAVPLVVMGGLYFLNHDYLMVLFNTQAGHKLLLGACVSMVIGIMVITRMAKLDTSR